jgi:hypothetical protein
MSLEPQLIWPGRPKLPRILINSVSNEDKSGQKNQTKQNNNMKAKEKQNKIGKEVQQAARQYRF